jgi:hypothetical protein
MSSGRMLLTDEHPPSRLAACDTRTCHNKAPSILEKDSGIYGILVKTATLHDSDFVNRMQPIKNKQIL